MYGEILKQYTTDWWLTRTCLGKVSQTELCRSIWLHYILLDYTVVPESHICYTGEVTDNSIYEQCTVVITGYINSVLSTYCTERSDSSANMTPLTHCQVEEGSSYH